MDDRYVNASTYKILRRSSRISDARGSVQKSSDGYDIIISFRQQPDRKTDSISNQLISADVHKVDLATSSMSENTSVTYEEDWKNPIVTKVM